MTTTYHPAWLPAAARGATAARGTLDEMLARIVAGEQKEVAVLVKADVQGSAEAIVQALEKIGNDNAKGEYYLTDLVEIARAAASAPDSPSRSGYEPGTR